MTFRHTLRLSPFVAALACIVAFAMSPVSASAPTWTDRDTSTGAMWDIAFGASTFVALGDAGPALTKTSPTGETWTSRAGSPSVSYWWRMASGGTGGNEVFIATAGQNTDKVLRSTDGTTWTEVTAISGSWESIAYGNGVFVAVDDSKVMYSTDAGSTWSAVTTATDADVLGDWRAVTYGGTGANGKFVAVGHGSYTNVVMTSPDGINWTATRTTATPPAGSLDPTWFSVTWGGGRFVAVSNLGGCSNPNVNCTEGAMWSTDGVTWTRVALPVDAQNICWNDVTYGTVDGTSKFVAVGDCGSRRAMTSTDGGATWTTDSSVTTGSWISVGYANGVFVAVGAGSVKIMTLGTYAVPTTTTSTTTTTTVAPSNTTASTSTTVVSGSSNLEASKALPKTGSNSSALVLMGALFCALGLASVARRKFMQ